MEWKKQFKNDDEVDEAVGRLGNLCLVAQNKDLGRELWPEKRKIFASSELALTKQLAAFQTWNMETINRRQAKLAKYAVAAWRFQ